MFLYNSVNMHVCFDGNVSVNLCHWKPQTLWVEKWPEHMKGIYHAHCQAPDPALPEGRAALAPGPLQVRDEWAFC